MFKVYYDGGFVFVAKEEMDEFVKWANENGVPYKIVEAESSALIDARS